MTAIALADRLERFLRGTWTASKRVQGLQGAARAFVPSLIAERERRPILIVASSTGEAENLYEDFNFFLGGDPGTALSPSRVHLFPSWEVLPFENLSPHPENIAGRLEGLYRLVEEPAPILIATPAALMQRVIAKASLKRSYLYLVAGQDLAGFVPGFSDRQAAHRRPFTNGAALMRSRAAAGNRPCLARPAGPCGRP